MPHIDTPALPPSFAIRHAAFPADLGDVVAIFREYVASPAADLGFQDYETEFAALPGKYAEPDGRILLAWQGGALVGCAALRRVDGSSCELKRVYVRPAARGHGVGRGLVESMIREARQAGYATMYLDVLPEFGAARQLYRSLGFVPARAVSYNPVEGTAFLALALAQDRPDIEVRRAGNQDLEGIEALYAEAGYGGGIGAADTVFVATDAGRTVGVVRLCPEHGVTVLRGMQVDAGWQRRGIGSLLLQACRAQLDQGPAFCLPYVHLDGFYGAAGFEAADAGRLPPFLAARLATYLARGQDVIAMRREPASTQLAGDVLRDGQVARRGSE